MNYTKEMISIFNKENIEKIKLIIYCIKELINKRTDFLQFTLSRKKLLEIYDKCRSIEIKNNGTDKEILNFFDYYYISIIKEIEKNIIKEE